MENKNKKGKISYQMLTKIKEILHLRMKIQNIQKEDEELVKIINNVWENGNHNINFFTLNNLNAFVDIIIDLLNQGNSENYSNSNVSILSLNQKNGTATGTVSAVGNFSKKECYNLNKTRQSKSLKKNIRPFKFNQYEKLEKQSIKFYMDDSLKNSVNKKGNLELEMIDNAQQEINYRIQRGKLLQNWVNEKKAEREKKLQ